MPADPLQQPHAELRAAANAIASMKSAKSFEDFESSWRIFLNCLEKVWTKTERCCQPMRSKFQPWQGQYHRLRKKDMLLRYLKQARDADNHSIQDVAKIEPGHRGIRFVNPKGGYIKHMEIRGGDIIAYEGDPIVVGTKPPQVVAVAVMNNGEWFNPPTSHLGDRVSTHHPVALAELGLKFYEKFIADVERDFFAKNEP